MGLGKTAQVVGAVNSLPDTRRILIVCPALARGVWYGEWQKFSVRADLSPTILLAGYERPTEFTVLICSYEGLLPRPWLGEEQWDLVVLDECHFTKNPDSKRTKAATKLRAARRIAVSGTPILSRGEDLLPVLGWLRPELFGDEGELFLAIQGVFGSAKNQLLQERLRDTVMIRRLKEDVLADLPPKVRQIIPLRPEATEGLAKAVADEEKLHAKVDDLIGEAEKNLALAKLGSESDYQQAQERLGVCVRKAKDDLFKLQHEIGRCKVPQVMEHVQALLEDGRKVIVFVKHQDVAAQLMQGFEAEGANPVLLNGTVDSEKRHAAVEAFQTNGAVRVVVAGIQAAGQAITLTAATNVVFGELDWTPALHLQGEDRAHRIGQRECVHCQYLVAGELDTRICRVLEDKARTIGETLGAQQNDDRTWLFRESQSWSNALRGIGPSRLAGLGGNIRPEEHPRIRRLLREERVCFRNPTDVELVDKLLSLESWSDNQAGAALVLRDRIRSVTRLGPTTAQIGESATLS